jgi:hypothetical protein
VRRDYYLTEDDEVFKGISRKAHPDWLGWRSVDRAKEAVGSSPRAVLNRLNADYNVSATVKLFYRKNPRP